MAPTLREDLPPQPTSGSLWTLLISFINLGMSQYSQVDKIDHQGEDTETLEHLHSAGGMKNDTVLLENNTEIPQK